MKLLPSLIVLLFLFPFLSYAPPHKTELISAPSRMSEKTLLTKVICKYETRAEKNPNDSFGHTYGEIGRCQVWLATARRVSKFLGTNQELINDIFARPEWYGKKVIEECYRYGWRNPQDAAMCYHRGPGFNKKDLKTRLYGKNITQRFAYWKMKQNTRRYWSWEQEPKTQGEEGEHG